MGQANMHSFRLLRPVCPRCNSNRTRIDWARLGNLWRLPTVIVSAVLFYPAVGLLMRCPDCGRRFLISRDAEEAVSGPA
jgi:transposase-like protein